MYPSAPQYFLIAGGKDQKMMNPRQWDNDVNAIVRISTVDKHQEEWLEKILSDPIAGKERLAYRKIDYGQ